MNIIEYFKDDDIKIYPDLRPDGRDQAKVKDQFNILLQKNNLETNNSELFGILCMFSYNWNLVDFRLTYKTKSNQVLKEFQLLIDLIRSRRIDVTRIEFGQSGSLGSITDVNVIATILDTIDLNKLNRIIRPYDYENDFDESKTQSINDIKYWFIENYIYPLFHFLKNETELRNDSDNAIYRFIKDFCCLAGVDWDVFSTQDPASYLKKTFHLIKKS